MNIKELRTQTGLTKKDFSKLLEIPYRTIQNWEGGQRLCPEYLLKLIEYYLKNEKLIPSTTDIYSQEAKSKNNTNITPQETEN